MNNGMLKMIKAINQRLATFEKKGLTDSTYYKSILNAINMSPNIITTSSKTGTQRISRSKLYMEEMSTSEIYKVWKKPSLKEEKEKIKKQMQRDLRRKVTNLEIEEHIRQRGKLEEWIGENLTEVYHMERADNERLSKAATVIHQALNDGLRRYDYNVVWDMIHEYEEAKSDYEAYLSAFYVESDDNGVFDYEDL